MRCLVLNLSTRTFVQRWMSEERTYKKLPIKYLCSRLWSIAPRVKPPKNSKNYQVKKKWPSTYPYYTNFLNRNIRQSSSSFPSLCLNVEKIFHRFRRGVGRFRTDPSYMHYIVVPGHPKTPNQRSYSLNCNIIEPKIVHAPRSHHNSPWMIKVRIIFEWIKIRKWKKKWFVNFDRNLFWLARRVLHFQFF